MKTTHRAPLAALLQRSKLPSHPTPHARPFKVAKISFFSHDVRIYGADLITQAVEEIGLLLEILVLGIHLAELTLRGLGVGEERLAPALELIKILLARAHGFHLLADSAFVVGEGRYC